KSVAVGLELMPRRGAELPRHPDTPRSRSRRQRRAMTTLAVLLLVAATGVGALAYRDYESTRAGREYQLAVANAEDFIASAHRLADRKPPDPDGARERMASATAKLDEASRSTFVVPEKIAALRADIAALTDRLDSETGQLWKHESNDGVRFGPAIGYLATPLAPNAARALAVDGDVWIVTSAGDLQRFRRNPLVTTASRIDFVPRWEGTAPRAN